nr:polysaccharide biosynthesis C-terminal domain-containing protein [Micromonospora sp. DSM 115978]
AAEHGNGNGNGIVTKAVVGSLAIGLPAVLLVCAAAPWVVPWLLGPSYGDVVGLLWLLAPGAVVYGSNKVIGDVLRGLDRSITVAWAEAAAVVVTVVLLVVLLPVVGVAAAAIASTAAYVVAFGFLVRALFKHSGMTVGLAAGRLRRSHPST